MGAPTQTHKRRSVFMGQLGLHPYVRSYAQDGRLRLLRDHIDYTRGGGPRETCLMGFCAHEHLQCSPYDLYPPVYYIIRSCSRFVRPSIQSSIAGKLPKVHPGDIEVDYEKVHPQLHPGEVQFQKFTPQLHPSPG
jgi:hypothetical protein